MRPRVALHGKEAVLANAQPVHEGGFLMYAIGLAAIILTVFAIACGEPEGASPPTAVPAAKPTETPVSTPTPTQTEDLIVNYKRQIDEKVQEQGSSCNLNKNFEAVISWLSTKSINYLRTYWEKPQLSSSDIRYMIDYLEGQRGSHERLCNQERERTVPEVKNVSDIVNHYDTFDEKLSEDKPCGAAERSQALSSTFSRENINYARGFFDAPWLNDSDLLQLIAHFESEAGHYAALCDKKK